jgi:hypothetical protein
LRAGEPTLIPAERVRTALETAGSRRQGCGPWQCPAHDDRQASLSVKEGRGGRVLLHCHAGCETQDVLAALSLDWADLFPGDRNGKARAEIVATYDYTDADGHLLYQTVRYFPKAFKRRRPDGNGGWTWSLQGVQQVLYRLPRVLAAVAATEPVYVVEGEKDVHAVERAGATATTVLGGVNGTWPPEFSRLLAKTCTVVVADDDDPGRQRARRIAASIGEHGGQVELVGPVTGKDASDHLAAGKTLADFLPLDAQAAVDFAVDGAELLEEVYGALERYVVFPSGEAAVAVTLWVAASHAQPAWEHATRMVVKSPLKRCGKTRLLDVLEALSHNALPTVNISVAALVRSIDEADPPTLLLDEADTIFVRRRGERAEAAEDLRGILTPATAAGGPTSVGTRRPAPSSAARPSRWQCWPPSVTCPTPSRIGRWWWPCDGGHRGSRSAPCVAVTFPSWPSWPSGCTAGCGPTWRRSPTAGRPCRWRIGRPTAGSLWSPSPSWPAPTGRTWPAEPAGIWRRLRRPTRTVRWASGSLPTCKRSSATTSGWSPRPSCKSCTRSRRRPGPTCTAQPWMHAGSPNCCVPTGCGRRCCAWERPPLGGTSAPTCSTRGVAMCATSVTSVTTQARVLRTQPCYRNTTPSVTRRPATLRMLRMLCR